MKEKELDLLIEQRKELVEALANRNAIFHKVIITFISGLISLILVKEYGLRDVVVLILTQVVILSALFIEALLISANNERYYISAIDDYVEEHYGITTLFYQGNLCRKHVIGLKGFFPFITSSIGVTAGLFSIWIFFRLDIWLYIIRDTFFLLIFIYECIVFMSLLIGNYICKIKKPQIYIDCINQFNKKRK